jgi:hypothetical protein
MFWFKGRVKGGLFGLTYDGKRWEMAIGLGAALVAGIAIWVSIQRAFSL